MYMESVLELQAAKKVEELQAKQIDTLERQQWLTYPGTAALIKGLKNLIEEKRANIDHLALRLDPESAAKLQLYAVEVITLKQVLNYARTGKYEYPATSERNIS